MLVREPIAESGLELLRSRFDVVEDADSDLGEIIGDFDAIVVRSATSLDAGLIERPDASRSSGAQGSVSTTSTSTPRRGAASSWRMRPEATVVSAAEHALALLFAVARSVPQAHMALKQGAGTEAGMPGSSWPGRRSASSASGGSAGRSRGVPSGSGPGRRVRPVRRARPFPRARRRVRGHARGRVPRGRPDHAPPAAERRDARAPRRRGVRADARRCPDRQRRPRRARRRGRAPRGDRVGQGRGGGARRLR